MAPSCPWRSTSGSTRRRVTRHWSTIATGPHSTWAPGRVGLTVALAERGVPALGIDVTPYAVQIAQSSGALAILRDVFGAFPARAAG